jgi:hypothetical protein
MKHLFVILLLLVAAGCSKDPATTSSSNAVQQNSAGKTVEPSGRILRAGVFSKVSGGEVIESSKSSTGKVLSKLVMTFIREAERIPIKKDTILGYQYRLSNLPETGTVKLRRVLKHPEFQLPDGRVSSGSDFTMTKKVERSEVFAYDVYALNEDYEMVPGDWTFQIWYNGTMLLEQKFTTYWPEDEGQGADSGQS